MESLCSRMHEAVVIKHVKALPTTAVVVKFLHTSESALVANTTARPWLKRCEVWLRVKHGVKVEQNELGRGGRAGLRVIVCGVDAHFWS